MHRSRSSWCLREVLLVIFWTAQLTKVLTRDNMVCHVWSHRYNEQRSSRDHLPPNFKVPPEVAAIVRVRDVVCTSRLGGASTRTRDEPRRVAFPLLFKQCSGKKIAMSICGDCRLNRSMARHQRHDPHDTMQFHGSRTHRPMSPITNTP